VVTRRRNPAIHRGIARERPSLKGVVQWLPRRRLRRRRLQRSPPRRPRRRSSSSALRSTQGSWHLPAPLCVCGGLEIDNVRQRAAATAPVHGMQKAGGSSSRRPLSHTVSFRRLLSHAVVGSSCYAAAGFGCSSGSGTGTGPQIYADSRGVSSARGPREMMMPRGSCSMTSARRS